VPIDWTSPVDRRHAVRFSFPDPDALPSPVDTNQPGDSLDWRGPSHQLGFGVMAAPTMDSLLQMVRSGLPGLAEQGLSPQYLIGATAAGAAALQGGLARRLGVEDRVYLRTDEHVQAWVLSCSADPLDLLVVAERAEADVVVPEHAEADVVGPSANTSGGGRRRPRRGVRGGTAGRSSAAGEATGGRGGEAEDEDILAPLPSLAPPEPEGEPDGAVSVVVESSAMGGGGSVEDASPALRKRVRRRRRKAA